MHAGKSGQCLACTADTLSAVFLDPQQLLVTFGTIGLFLIVFAESGLLIGFFLPGDSLLFTAPIAYYYFYFVVGWR